MKKWMRCVMVGLVLGFVGCDGPRGGVDAVVQNDRGEIVRDRGGLVGYVDGEKIYFDDIRDQLVEAGGGDVIVEVVLDRLIANALKKAGLSVWEKEIAWERKLVMEGIHEDQHQAARLFEALQLQRGIGDVRFAKTLRRNASLRKLVAGKVVVSEEAIRQRYGLQYGPRQVVRMIMKGDLDAINAVLGKLKGGGDFSGIAVAESDDKPSAERGGLLSGISAFDTSYSQGIREAVGGLKVGELSGVTEVIGGYAIFRCERMIEAKKIGLEDAREAIAWEVRRELEGRKMQTLVKGLIGEAEVMIFDGGVKAGWEYQMKLMKRR